MHHPLTPISRLKALPLAALLCACCLPALATNGYSPA
jgi:hypothetical protein